jgi:hypothetical protein
VSPSSVLAVSNASSIASDTPRPAPACRSACQPDTRSRRTPDPD